MPPTWEQHLHTLEQVFMHLPWVPLTLNLVKSHFRKTSVTNLVNQVGGGQVRPVEAKITAIREFPVQATRKALRSILGLASYYRSFNETFDHRPAPHKLAHPHVSLRVVSRMSIHYCECKTLLCSAPVVATPIALAPLS